ncbi:1-hydroxy-2-methyl-2-butenyl 4-diphosphate reductase [Streptomyces sp. CB01881]|uniref:5'-methylthioadenosine/S-adenosylhomocysteine nucleosidase family protein n=1 Tax=Streptomyces sp. CB01881 TaxID=2078691 RepID=UPI000CDC0DCB|nr:1-hydroxy-2-methyl-2-butenyl 4-diphosphate reductase [Streptomyces sp. CB01881]AUY48769.1 1-hydroxy-2-methyl-2-butenyl 4-diphosphate reductase [Streptomyces sp. CB01881]TYC77259.1 1-hydroxy-2-methyl-2-butenyl 4-diphosphate reductase [Streptomyces sp. CB01881]
MNRAPLLVLCALGPEVWALRGGDWRGAAGGPPVLVRTGVGRRRASHAVRRLLTSAPGGYGAVVVAGFGAAVAPGMAPGDVIVADGVRNAEGNLFAVDSGPELTRALKVRGLTAHTGVHHTADHVVRGLERRALHLQGALAVDMEAAAVLAALQELRPAMPAAVLRVVVDTPEHELLRPGTLPAGVRAWRTLRATVPALVDWHEQHRPARSRPAPGSTNQPTSSTLPQEAS